MARLRSDWWRALALLPGLALAFEANTGGFAPRTSLALFVAGCALTIAPALLLSRHRGVRGDLAAMRRRRVAETVMIALFLTSQFPRTLIPKGSGWLFALALLPLAAVGVLLSTWMRPADSKRVVRDVASHHGWTTSNDTRAFRPASGARSSLAIELPFRTLFRRGRLPGVPEGRALVSVAGLEGWLTIAGRNSDRSEPALDGALVGGDPDVLACLLAFARPRLLELVSSRGTLEAGTLSMQVVVAAAEPAKALRTQTAWLLRLAREIRRAHRALRDPARLLAAVRAAPSPSLRDRCAAILRARFPDSAETAEAQRLVANAAPGQLAIAAADAARGAVSVASTPGAVSLAKKATT